MTTRDNTKSDTRSDTESIKEGESGLRSGSEIGELHQDSTDGISVLTDEIVMENVHPSWTNWPITLGLAMLFGLVALMNIAQLELSNAVGSLIVVGLLVGYVYLARKRSRYVVTNQRVVSNVGLLRNSSDETRIKDIRSMATKQGLLERLFRKGSVKIDSTGADGHLDITGVKNHEQFANVIRERQRELES